MSRFIRSLEQEAIGQLLKECTCYIFVKSVDVVGGDGDSVSHHLWRSNYVWLLLYFFFLLSCRIIVHIIH